jgi:tripartite-type tricarboxylate transporter receptor subunit TctC
MKKKIAWSIAIVGGLILSLSPPAVADDFYQGKTIRIIVGFAAGGGYDTYARAVARATWENTLRETLSLSSRI